MANDAWTGGAGNHTPATEGPYADRRAATPTQVTGDWRSVSTVRSRTFTSESGKVLAVHPGAGGRRLAAP